MVTGVVTISWDAYGGPSKRRTPRDTGRCANLRDFIAGNENALARHTAEQLLGQLHAGDAPRGNHSPLLFWGPSGTGKSHLVRGIAEAWPRCRPDNQVTLTTGADFARDYATAIDVDDVEHFHARYRTTQLLVLDGLEQLARKNTAQQELARTLDALNQTGGYVIVTSLRIPADITGLISPLISRLSWGLSIPLRLPGPAARRVLVNCLAKEHDVKLTPAVLQTIAETSGPTAPKLQAAILKLKRSVNQDQPKIDEPLLRQLLDEDNCQARVSVSSIRREVGRYYQLKSADLQGPSRRQNVVLARGIAMYLTRLLTSNSLQRIGQYFGNRDHTTVLHACRKIESLVPRDSTVQLAIDEIRGRISK